MMKTTKFDWRGIENLQKDCDYSNHIMTMMIFMNKTTMMMNMTMITSLTKFWLEGHKNPQESGQDLFVGGLKLAPPLSNMLIMMMMVLMMVMTMIIVMMRPIILEIMMMSKTIMNDVE